METVQEPTKKKKKKWSVTNFLCVTLHVHIKLPNNKGPFRYFWRKESFTIELEKSDTKSLMYSGAIHLDCRLIKKKKKMY